MCCLYGLLDYGHSLSVKNRKKILRELGIAGEMRGQDATGLAWFEQGWLEIQKAPKPASQFGFHLPPDAAFVIGHTRMTTQGSAACNYNNHPFGGCTCGTSFALAHNGIIYNDRLLQEIEGLPATRVETDSYVAVQLLEQRPLSMSSVARMAEKLEGTFTFSVLVEGGIYLVKGNSPLYILDFPTKGFYLYASTELVMEKALQKIHLKAAQHREVPIQQGEILYIDSSGAEMRGVFDDTSIRIVRPHWPGSSFLWDYAPFQKEDDYLQQVLSCGQLQNVPEAELRLLIDAGYDAMDLEEIIYDSHLRQCCLEEILWEGACYPC